jgi:ABC-type transport system involved in Fe-S cluster assembly fused permease/ATPase subunit
MYKNSYPGDCHYVIVVLMWIFVTMIVVMVIMRVRSEYFLEKVDKEKAYYKGINSIITFFECLREYMNERNRKHRSRTQCDEEVEYFLINCLEEIENDSEGRNQKKTDNDDER